MATKETKDKLRDKAIKEAKKEVKKQVNKNKAKTRLKNSKKKQKELYDAKEWYTIRALLGNQWANWFLLIGARERTWQDFYSSRLCLKLLFQSKTQALSRTVLLDEIK